MQSSDTAFCYYIINTLIEIWGGQNAKLKVLGGHGPLAPLVPPPMHILWLRAIKLGKLPFKWDGWSAFDDFPIVQFFLEEYADTASYFLSNLTEGVD